MSEITYGEHYYDDLDEYYQFVVYGLDEIGYGGFADHSSIEEDFNLGLSPADCVISHAELYHIEISSEMLQQLKQDDDLIFEGPFTPIKMDNINPPEGAEFNNFYNSVNGALTELNHELQLNKNSVRECISDGYSKADAIEFYANFFSIEIPKDFLTKFKK